MNEFQGTPKKNFRQLMIISWMAEGCFETEEKAIKNYGGEDFDKLCERFNGDAVLSFKMEIGSTTECFEIKDNNFVIPVSAIEISKESAQALKEQL